MLSHESGGILHKKDGARVVEQSVRSVVEKVLVAEQKWVFDLRFITLILSSSFVITVSYWNTVSLFSDILIESNEGHRLKQA